MANFTEKLHEEAMAWVKENVDERAAIVLTMDEVKDISVLIEGKGSRLIPLLASALEGSEDLKKLHMVAIRCVTKRTLERLGLNEAEMKIENNDENE